jgi:hypothetical protein
MDEQLKENEDLEKIFEQIRDICGTNNLDQIVDFIMLRNKRYNYACQEIQNCEKKNKKLKKDIKILKNELTELKNNLLVQEKGENGKEIDVELSTNPDEDAEIIETEKTKNKNLLELGKKYNEIDGAYNLVLQNMASMIEVAKKNDLISKNNENVENSENIPLELTNEELKMFNDVEITRKERKELDNYTLNEEEKLIVKRTRLTEKEKREIEIMEFSELEKVIRYNLNDEKLTQEEKEIAEEIINVNLTEDEIKKAKDIVLFEDEEKLAVRKSTKDNTELSSEDKKKKIEYFKELKIKYNKYKKQQAKINAGYKIKKMKKNKEDLINNYELLLKAILKRYNELLLLRNKQEIINILKTKGVKVDSSTDLIIRNVGRGRGTKRIKTKRLSVEGKRGVTKRYKKLKYGHMDEDDEEEDKSEDDPDAKILNKFLKEQKKEKENFVSGKTKIEEKK